MPVLVNLRLLEENSAQLEGEVPLEEFATELRDPLMNFAAPLAYQVEADKQPEGVLLRGSVSTRLACRCARCLEEFELPVLIADFAALAPLQGEGALNRNGDFGDLTPYLREDIYLALPTNPLCKPECRGLAPRASARDLRLETAKGDGPAAWAALDQLKL